MKKVMIVLFGFALSISAQINNISLLGRWATGECIQTAVNGNYAYTSSGLGLTIVDISDPSNPFAVSQIVTPSRLLKILYRDEMIFVANDTVGLSIYDVSDPFSPSLISNLDTEGFAEDLSLLDDFAYLADSWNGLRIIDVSNPNNPQEVGSLFLFGYARGISAKDTLAFLAMGEDGVKIVNIKNPTIPSLVSEFDTDGSAKKLQVQDHYLYIADGSDGVRVMDISNPYLPQEVGFFDTDDLALDIFINDTLAFVDDGDGFYILDIGDPMNISEISYSYTNCQSIFIQGDYAFLSGFDDGIGLSIFNITNLFEPVQISFYNTAADGYIEAIAIQDDYAYLCEDNGLRIIDISDKNRPIATSYYRFIGQSWNIFVKDNYVYMATQTGFRVFNVSNPYEPELIAHYSGAYKSIQVINSLAYLIFNQGLKIFDISNPYEPQEVGIFNRPYTNSGLSVTNDKAYFGVGAGWQGVQIIDISMLDSLRDLGIYYSTEVIKNLVANNNLVYAAEYGNGMEIIDVTDPAFPVQVGLFITEGSVQEIKIIDNYAYLATYWGGIKILNLDNPVVPIQEGIYNTGFDAYNLDVQENIICVISSTHGLYILRNELITGTDLHSNKQLEYNLFQNYPNPFNPITKINFTIPGATNIRINIFDILGNKIKTLVAEYKQAGNYEIEFDASNLPSGVYFYRLSSGSYSETKKMILIR